MKPSQYLQSYQNVCNYGRLLKDKHRTETPATTLNYVKKVNLVRSGQQIALNNTKRGKHDWKWSSQDDIILQIILRHSPHHPWSNTKEFFSLLFQEEDCLLFRSKHVYSDIIHVTDLVFVPQVIKQWRDGGAVWLMHHYLGVDLLVDGSFGFLLLFNSQQVHQRTNGHPLHRHSTHEENQETWLQIMKTPVPNCCSIH